MHDTPPVHFDKQIAKDDSAHHTSPVEIKKPSVMDMGKDNRPHQDVDRNLLNSTVTKDITVNCNTIESSLECNSDSSTDCQGELSIPISNTNDQFDGIIYNISQSENKTIIS